MKYLLVVLVVVVAVWWWLRALRRPEPSRRKGAGKPTADAAPQSMVSCAHCGIHFPAADAVEADGRRYCCAGHRDAGPANR